MRGQHIRTELGLTHFCVFPAGLAVCFLPPSAPLPLIVVFMFGRPAVGPWFDLAEVTFPLIEALAVELIMHRECRRRKKGTVLCQPHPAGAFEHKVGQVLCLACVKLSIVAGRRRGKERKQRSEIRVQAHATIQSQGDRTGMNWKYSDCQGGDADDLDKQQKEGRREKKIGKRWWLCVWWLIVLSPELSLNGDCSNGRWKFTQSLVLYSHSTVTKLAGRCYSGWFLGIGTVRGVVRSS